MAKAATRAATPEQQRATTAAAAKKDRTKKSKAEHAARAAADQAEADRLAAAKDAADYEAMVVAAQRQAQQQDDEAALSLAQEWITKDEAMATAAQRQADEVRAHQWEQEQLAQVEWRRQQQAEEDLGDQSAATELQQLLDLEQTMPSPPQHEQVPQPQSMMASPSPTPAQQLPECPVCMECYDHPPAEQAPVVLPCGHSICRQCALDLQTANPGRQRGSGTLAIVCPSCCQQLELPPGGAQALPCNYGLVQVLEPSAPLALQQAVAAPLSTPRPHQTPALEHFGSGGAVGGMIGCLSQVCAPPAALSLGSPIHPAVPPPPPPPPPPERAAAAAA